MHKPVSKIPNTPLSNEKQIFFIVIIIVETHEENKAPNNHNQNLCSTHCNATRMLIPDSTTIGSRQYPNTETTAPNVTAACVAITLNKA